VFTLVFGEVSWDAMNLCYRQRLRRGAILLSCPKMRWARKQADRRFGSGIRASWSLPVDYDEEV